MTKRIKPFFGNGQKEKNFFGEMSAPNKPVEPEPKAKPSGRKVKPKRVRKPGLLVRLLQKARKRPKASAQTEDARALEEQRFDRLLEIYAELYQVPKNQVLKR